MGPRGAIPRKEGGPPRGIEEDGFPRGPELRLALNIPVDSINTSSGARVGLGGPRRDIYPMDEVKPRVEDACVSMCILWAVAELPRVAAVIVMLFDYK